MTHTGPKSTVVGVVLTIALLVCTQSSSAKSLFLGAGAGYTSLGGTSSGGRLALKLNADLIHRHSMLTLRYIENLEFRINLGFGGSSQRTPNREVAFLVGLFHTNRGQTMISISGGMGSVSGRVYDNAKTQSEAISFSAVGLALQGQVYFRNVGIDLVGDINGTQSFGGGILSFRIDL